MKFLPTTRVIVILALLAAVITGLVFTRPRSMTLVQMPGVQDQTAKPLVDQNPLHTAQALAPYAATPAEKALAQEALRVGDHAVDLAFTIALQNSQDHPPPLSAAARQVQPRITALQSRLQDFQEQIDRLNKQIPKASATRKTGLSEQMELAQAQSELFKDSLLNAQRDFQRAGGDQTGVIEQLQQEHAASSTHPTNEGSPLAVIVSPSVADEVDSSPSVATQVRAWFSLRAKGKLLVEARKQAIQHAAELTASYSNLKSEIAGKTQSTAPPTPAAKEPASSANSAAGTENTKDTLSAVKALANKQKSLSQIDYSIKDENTLAGLYSQWLTLVQASQLACIHWLLRSLSMILVILLLLSLAEPALERLFDPNDPDWRKMHAVRSFLHFGLRAAGTIAILLVIFGVPQQVGTILAVAGAGLTVALQDFILGFLGWFTLMGKNGIRPGDWVEINGVYGEVLDVGLLHTNLLERGKWADGSYPTGRKVTFVNSFPIQGHYFNFTTSGQWLWDEIEVTLPADANPQVEGDAVRRIVDDETSKTAPIAQEEWQRVTTATGRPSVTSEPTFAIRPVGGGVSVRVRYLTPVAERHQIRNRIFAKILELLHAEPVGAAGPERNSTDERAGGEESAGNIGQTRDSFEP
jgi:small-conductance mechanosensitive channel